MLQFILRQLLGQAGRTIGNEITDLNRPETFADRIKRDFHLHDYADAWALYSSDPAYWEKYYNSLPKLAWNDELVHDSAATAGAPSRYNVFEYGFPEAGGMQPSSEAVPEIRRSSAQLAPSNGPSQVRGLAAAAGIVPSTATEPAPIQQSAFGTGPSANRSYAGPIPQRPSVPNGGLPGLIASVTGSDPSDPTRFQPSAGGLLGLIQDAMRNNPAAGGSR